MFNYMGKKIILFFFSSLLVFSFNTMASDEVKNDYTHFSFYSDFLQISSEERFYFLEDKIKENGHLVKVETETDFFYIPIHSFLLIQGHEKLAAQLVKERLVEPFEVFNYGNGDESSDLVLAIESNNIDYFNAVIEDIDDIDKRFIYSGEKGFTLLMVSAMNKTPSTYIFTHKLLTRGANLNILSYNDLSPITIAQSKENRIFLNASNDFSVLERSKKDAIDFLKNNQISGEKRLRQNRVMENLEKGLLKELLSEDEPHEHVFDLTLRGYTKAALKLIKELEEKGDFNPNYKNEDNFSLLMATSMADIIGGDVEVASKLIALGADINYITEEDYTEGEIAVVRDAYKVLFLLISHGFDPFTPESSSKGVDLMSLSVITDPVAINSLNVLTLMYEEYIE